MCGVISRDSLTFRVTRVLMIGTCHSSRMPIPSISELELAASKIVWNAKKNGNLKLVFQMFISLKKTEGFLFQFFI